MRKISLLVLGCVALFASGCSNSSSVELNVGGFPVISTHLGCRGIVHEQDGSTSIRMRVGRAGAEAVETVNVCFGSKGPFAFIVDTGAATTTVDSSLAKKLHLPWSGPSSGSSGAGCTSTSRPAAVKSWAVGGLWLDPQSVQVQSMPGFGGKGNAWGLLGSDVWNRFGALRFDFLHERLVVPRSEGQPPSGDEFIAGGTGPDTPATLIHSRVSIVAPMDVARGSTYTEMLVYAQLGKYRRLAMAPDTGSSSSLIDTTTAARAGLHHTKFTESGTTVCSTITTKYVTSGHWLLAGLPLPGTMLSTLPLGPIKTAGFSGLLGSDVMSKYPSVVFDYDGGRLLLGAG
ncbi:MAG: pepsin/retropepsin-like aspartic protease family protein [Actinomycetota bacterium]